MQLHEVTVLSTSPHLHHTGALEYKVLLHSINHPPPNLYFKRISKYKDMNMMFTKAETVKQCYFTISLFPVTSMSAIIANCIYNL